MRANELAADIFTKQRRKFRQDAPRRWSTWLSQKQSSYLIGLGKQDVDRGETQYGHWTVVGYFTLDGVRYRWSARESPVNKCAAMIVTDVSTGTVENHERAKLIAERKSLNKEMMAAYAQWIREGSDDTDALEALMGPYVEKIDALNERIQDLETALEALGYQSHELI